MSTAKGTYSNNRTTDMTVGRPTKLILDFFWPLFAGNVFQQLYSLVDSAVVGRGIDGAALAAVGATGSLSFFIIGFAQGLCSGFGVNMAVEFGAKNYERLRKVVAMSLLLSLTISAVFTVIALTTMRPLLLVLKTDPDILEDSIRYISVIFGGIAITILYNIIAALLRALGDSRTPFIAIILASCINVALDLLFILVFKWGVAGASAATIFAQFCSCIFCIGGIRKLDVLQLKKEHFVPDFRLCWQLLSIGIPVAFMSSITAIGCLIVQYFVNGFGKLTISAYAAICKIISLSMQPSGTIGTALSTFVGQNYGAKKYDRISQGMKSATLIGLVLSTFIFIMDFFFPKQLVGIMVSEPEIIALAPFYLKLCGVGMYAVCELHLVRNACTALKRTFVPLLSGGLELALRVASLLLFSASMGFNAVPIAEVAAWTGAMILNGIAYLVTMNNLKHGVDRMATA